MDLFLDLRDTGKKGSSISEKDVLAPHQLAGLFVIDEFQERGGSDWENRIITGLIDRRYSNNLPTIIIANLDRREMGAALNPSVVDRIRENGKAFTFDWPSFRTPQ
jgi:DNA replication protein DnaC